MKQETIQEVEGLTPEQVKERLASLAEDEAAEIDEDNEDRVADAEFEAKEKKEAEQATLRRHACRVPDRTIRGCAGGRDGASNQGHKRLVAQGRCKRNLSQSDARLWVYDQKKNIGFRGGLWIIEEEREYRVAGFVFLDD